MSRLAVGSFCYNPPDISARECLLWGKCEGSVFLVSNDLSSVPDASQFQACVCVLAMETGCAYTLPGS